MQVGVVFQNIVFFFTQGLGIDVYIIVFRNIQIFFVYNTSRNEIDNGLESILYFYPEWVSDDQKGALCGQIIGTIQCMKNLFSKPDIISLQNGKFLVIESKKVYFVSLYNK